MYAVRDWLFIGKYSDTRNLEALQSESIGAMLQLAERVSQPGIASQFIDMRDGEPVPASQFDAALAYIRTRQTRNDTILVACGAGISRSSIVVMAALMDHEGLALFDAYRALYRAHPTANPHYALVQSLAAYHGETLSMIEAWEGLMAVREGK